MKGNAIKDEFKISFLTQITQDNRSHNYQKKTTTLIKIEFNLRLDIQIYSTINKYVNLNYKSPTATVCVCVCVLYEYICQEWN